MRSGFISIISNSALNKVMRVELQLLPNNQSLVLFLRGCLNEEAKRHRYIYIPLEFIKLRVWRNIFVYNIEKLVFNRSYNLRIYSYINELSSNFHCLTDLLYKSLDLLLKENRFLVISSTKSCIYLSHISYISSIVNIILFILFDFICEVLDFFNRQEGGER